MQPTQGCLPTSLTAKNASLCMLKANNISWNKYSRLSTSGRISESKNLLDVKESANFQMFDAF